MFHKFPIHILSFSMFFAIVMAPACKTPEAQESETSSSKKKYEFLLVMGYLNETQIDYFDDIGDTAGYIKTKYGHTTKVTKLKPPSNGSIESNSKLVLEKIRKLVGKSAAKKDSKLVILAHSKGVPETMIALTKLNSDERKKLHAVYFIQGAIGGSPVATYLSTPGDQIGALLGFVNKGEKIDRDALKKHVFSKYGNAVQKGLAFALDGKLTSDQIKTVKRNFESGSTADRAHMLDMLYLHGASSYILKSQTGAGLESLKTLNGNFMSMDLHTYAKGRVNYIVTTKPTASTRELLDCTSWYIDKREGPNDGMVSAKHQVPNGVSVFLRLEDADHLDTVVAFGPLGNSTQKRMMEAIFKSIDSLSY